MSPFKLKILLHYYACPNQYMGPENVNAVTDAVTELKAHGLLGDGQNLQRGQTYVATAKGEAHIEAILNLPLPVSVWVTPYPKK